MKRTFIPLSKTQLIGFNYLVQAEKDFLAQCLFENATPDERGIENWIFNGKGFTVPYLLQDNVGKEDKP